jgi:hypothetical protein
MEFDLSGLKTGVVVVTFMKKNGEERVMRCTQDMGMVPEEKHPTGLGGVYDSNQVRVFDLDKEEWRSFRKDSIIRIE